MSICSHCQVELLSQGNVTLQMGNANVLFPNMSNIMAGSLELELKVCPQCGKVEFYTGKGQPTGNVRCPSCGSVHEADRKRCNRCSHQYDK